MNKETPESAVSPMVVIATDCGGTDKARYEIAAKRCFFPSTPYIPVLETVSMSTEHAGFVATAHALSTIDRFGPLRPGEKVGLLVNAAPRQGKENSRKLRGRGRKKSGEEIYALLLDNDVWVVGPNAGMNFYFIARGRIKESYLLTGSGLHTPFRSMEFMVPALAQVLGYGCFSIRLTPKRLAVPVPKRGIFVGDWDSHGNMYLFSTEAEKAWLPKVGQRVTVDIGNVHIRLRRVKGIFAGHTGEATLTTGSLELNGNPVQYIVVGGGNAHGLFKHPPVGSQVFINRN